MEVKLHGFILRYFRVTSLDMEFRGASPETENHLPIPKAWGGFSKVWMKQLLLVCSIGLASPLFPQEKEQPPSFVTEESRRDTGGVDYSGPRLELPDVVIYGKDLVILRRNRPFYENQIESEVRESKKRLTGRRIGMKIPKLFGVGERTFPVTYLRVQYGSYSSHGVEFLNSSRISGLDYVIKLSHLGKGEWVENSQSKELESDLRIDWNVNQASLVSMIEYGKSEFGYYGESTQDRGTFTQYLLRQQLFLPYLELTLDASRDELNSSDREVTIGLSGKSQHRIESIPVRFRIDYLHAGGNGFLDVVHLGLYSHFSPYEWLNESFGLEFTSANRLKRVSPFVKVDVNSGIGFFVYYRTFVESHTTADQVLTNPYVKNPGPIAEEHLNLVTLGAYRTLRNGIRTQLTLSHENSKNKPFWKYDNQWSVHTMDTRRTSVKLDFTGRYLESFSTDLSLRYVHHSPSVPYTPSIVVEARVEYFAKSGMEVEGIGTYVGSRNTLASQLSAYTKVDLKLRKNLLRNLAIFGGIRNILDTEYEIISEYPEPGRKIYFGAKILF